MYQSFPLKMNLLKKKQKRQSIYAKDKNSLNYPQFFQCLLPVFLLKKIFVYFFLLNFQLPFLLIIQ